MAQSLPDVLDDSASAGKGHLLARRQRCHVEASRDRQNFISDEVEANARWCGPVEIKSSNRFENASTKFIYTESQALRNPVDSSRLSRQYGNLRLTWHL